MPTCKTCIYALTRREPCEGCLIPENEDASYAYRNYQEGDPFKELLKMQRSGERNIVIGGEGEHEVNVSWTMDEAYKHLAHVCEMCGGLVVKDGLTQLLLMKPYGPSFVIEYMHGKLYRISIRQHTPWWEAHDPAP